MSQNVSSAVMQQRREGKDSLDDFPTPPWATRALMERLKLMADFGLEESTCREPAANRGHMSRPLSEYFGGVFASDVHDYGAGIEVRDYLFGPAREISPTHWTITNPPFRLAEQFIDRALELSRVGVAMIVRTAFLEGIARHERLFSKRPPSYVMQFCERVVMHRGRLAPEGASATAYCWLVWIQGGCQRGTEFEWIPRCRKELERPGDYPLERQAIAGGGLI